MRAHKHGEELLTTCPYDSSNEENEETHLHSEGCGNNVLMLDAQNY
jgi:hypothetical protein